MSDCWDSSMSECIGWDYQRGRGLLRRRVVDRGNVFGRPLHWPASEVVATGSQVMFDAGNVNATCLGNSHALAFYSGKAPDTSVLVSVLPVPPDIGIQDARSAMR